MAQESAGTGWYWSEALQQHYFPTEENGRPVLILQDRRIVPDNRSVPARRPSQGPRSLRDPNEGIVEPQAYYDSENYIHSRRQPGASVNSGPSRLMEQFERLRVEGRSDNATSSPQPSQYQADSGTAGPSGARNRSSAVARNETLRGTAGDTEPLDSSYQKRREPRRFFKEGKVFFTLWTEPSTAAGTGPAFSIVRYGQRVHSGIRRFVVVKEGPNYCLACPIMTYGKQGVGKDGVAKHEHAIIYTGNRVPSALPGEAARGGERPMLDTAILVDPAVSGDRLDERSRVNLGKICTVEHNLKVKPFGTVRDTEILKSAWIEVRDAPPQLNAPIASAGRSHRQQPSTGVQQPAVSNSGLYAIPGSVSSAGSPRSIPRTVGSLGASGRGSPPQEAGMPSRSARAANAMVQQRTTGERPEQQEEVEGQSSSDGDGSSDEESEDEPETNTGRTSIQPSSDQGQRRACPPPHQQRPSSQQGGTSPGYYRRS